MDSFLKTFLQKLNCLLDESIISQKMSLDKLIDSLNQIYVFQMKNAYVLFIKVNNVIWKNFKIKDLNLPLDIPESRVWSFSSNSKCWGHAADLC